MAVNTPICDFGWKPPEFELPGVDGRTYRLGDFRGSGGTLIMFICNHCPYVKAVIDRVVRDAAALAPLGIETVAICSNDAVSYPEDSFENMQRVARELAYPFPYLLDATQEVARSYGAVCTPDFFGYNADLELQYRGRLDESGRQPDVGEVTRELFQAMKQVAETGRGPEQQIPSIGCSIKWRGQG